MEIITKNNIKKYSTYKNSGVEWLGEIPEHWEVIKLKYLSEIKTGYTPITSDSSNFSKNGTIWAKPDNLNDFNLIKNSKEKVSSKGIKSQNIIPKNSILVCCIGTIGKFGIAGVDLITNQQINSIIFNTKISNKYGKYLIANCKSEFNKWANGNVVSILNTSAQKNIYFLLPPLSEQTKIAEFLDDKTKKIDEAIAIKTQQINLLKERKQILIHKAVTRGLDTNVKLKNSGVEWIGEIPVHWEVKKVRYVFNLGKGLTITKENLRDKGIFCVNYGEIHSKYGFELDTNIHKLKCVNEDYLSSNSSALISNGDFIFADTSEDIEGSGNFTYLKSDNKIFAGYHTVIAKPKFQIESRFFAYIFESESFRNQIRTKVKGVKVYSITQSILKQPYVWFPSKEEQKEIVDYLDLGTKKIATAIGLKSEEIEKLKEYKSSLINSVVTGKVRVC
ncbi:restriction endonuclease subunit S [Tenacibaculum piscium]|uniref:restriction endonuclease subunit S n=1 Tax=Tenacibaculum piscium TaxID=1458515 RepID=UPI001F1EA70A|nr:restriction endonuclease subunit S [Tenacibaculum piscium]